MQLCDAFDLPIVSLCDTPGFMVGPEAEKTALVRHVARMFVIGANLTVPLFGIVLRKGYGLGAQAMIGGGFHAPFFTVSWPTGEFGGMGLEGSVRLGYRKELEAIADPEERKTYYARRSPSSMPTARRSRSPRCSRSTTSSTPPTRGAGSWRGCARCRSRKRARRRSGPGSMRGSGDPDYELICFARKRNLCRSLRHDGTTANHF